MKAMQAICVRKMNEDARETLYVVAPAETTHSMVPLLKLGGHWGICHLDGKSHH